MGARQIRATWEMRRAIFALSCQSGVPVNIEHYAEVFSLDLGETMEVFTAAADHLGLPSFLVTDRCLVYH